MQNFWGLFLTLTRSFICCYITLITVPLNIEYILFITLLTVIHYYSKLELRFNEEAMEKYKKLSDEHAYEFNGTEEMRQTQELVDDDSGNSMMG